MIKIYNTETRSKEVLEPMKKGHISMYTCGPTVYDFAHIGNFRTYIFEDLLRRTLKFFGYKVTQVMNITDLDDKTFRGALSKKISLDAYTKPYIDAFFEDIKMLHIEPAEYYPHATKYIPKMIEVIQELIKKGVAYHAADGCVYFAINKFPRYGCLSHLKLDELQVGASERAIADEYDKENVSDFVLWKAHEPDRDGDIFWESPFGQGRPGWHLECSTMAIEILGPSIDIHCGGVDNIFPHHENEIAQSEACSGKHFVKYWMHSEHLLVNNKKMSKSLGNFYTLRDLLSKGFTGLQIRYMLIHTHYKTQLNFTFEGLEGIKHSLDRIQDFIRRLYEIEQEKSSGLVTPLLGKTLNDFSEALADDLNISVALAAVFDLIRQINQLSDNQQVSKQEAEEVLQFLNRLNQVLGFLDLKKPDEEVAPDLLEALQNRIHARKNKEWAKADAFRDFIHERGYEIEDTPMGARLKKR